MDSAEEEPCSDLTNQSGNSNFVNEMLEQMEVSPDGEKKCPICSRVLKVIDQCNRGFPQLGLVFIVYLTEKVSQYRTVLSFSRAWLIC